MNILNKRMAASIIILLFLGSSIIPVLGEIGENQTGSYDDPIFDKKIELLMKMAHMPSLSVGIIKDDKLVWHRGYGLYDGNNTPDEHTAYLIASTTKSITATAIMQLYDKGLFDLDDDVSGYLPFELRNPNFPDIPITFRMILAHQSSLPGPGGTIDSKFWDHANPGLPEIGPFIKQKLDPNDDSYNPNIWRAKPPGTEYSYSNLGYTLLGYLVECITKESYDQYCKKHIFKPLDMHNTSFNISELNIENVAIPYIWYKLSFPNYRVWVAHPHGAGPIYPAGFLITSVSDLSHYLIAHMNGGVYNSVRILNGSTVKIMHTIQYPENKGINIEGKYGMGFHIKESLTKPTTIGHGGDVIGCHSNMMFLPSENIGIIYFTNRQLSKDFTGFTARLLLKPWMIKKARSLDL